MIRQTQRGVVLLSSLLAILRTRSLLGEFTDMAAILDWLEYMPRLMAHDADETAGFVGACETVALLVPDHAGMIQEAVAEIAP